MINDSLLTQRMIDWSRAIAIEHKVATIITQQEINGVKFDVEKAKGYVSELEERMQKLYDNIRPLLNKEVVQPYGVPVNTPFLKKGGYSKGVISWYGEEVPDIGGPFTRIRFEEPDLGKRQKLIAQLLRLGWEPEHYTAPTERFPNGQPKLTVDKEPVKSLEKLTGVGGDIALWYTLKHRQSQINGWLSNPRLEEDGRLTAGAIPCGTNTGRMRHNTVVNVPKAKDHVIFGKEMRSLFIVEDGYVMVGHDASALELRMLAHYMNDPEFTKAVVEGKESEGTDVHTLNQDLAGLPTRDDAKTFIYAFNYGAGDAKLGSIVGGTARDGAAIRQRFLKKNKSLGNLIERVQEAAKRGYLIGLDGRKLWMRRNDRGQIATNKALNTLLQGAGAVVMKVSMCYLDNWVKRDELDVKKIIDMHDEAQAEVFPEHAELYGNLAVQSIRQAGHYLNLNCPLDAEYKIGLNWSETH